MPTTEEHWLTPWRLKVYPRVLFACLMFAVALSIALAQGSSTMTGRLGGDLPAFYGAGQMVLDGNSAQLYDWEAQRMAQAGLHDGEADKFLAFAYPPFVALLYAPLALLPFGVAYAVHTLVGLAALGCAIQLMRPMAPRVDAHAFEAFALAFAFYPLFRAITGAQNTSFTLGALALVWWALHRNRPALAGAAAALLLFKPQFALPCLGLVCLRRPRALLGVVPVVAVYWALGARVGGAGWLSWWWAQIGQFHATDQAVNAANSVGVLGFAEALLGPGSSGAAAIGGAATAGLVLALAVLWRPKGAAPLDLRMAALTLGVLLVPPHSMFYDAGILVLPLAVLGNRRGREALPWLAAASAVAVLAVGATAVGVNPLFAVAVGTGVAVLRELRRLARPIESPPAH